MSSTSKHIFDAGNKTQCIESSSATGQNSPAMDYLVVVREKEQIVEIFRPLEKHITVGRSSKNSITLPDPRFPRMAGEIILGPVPILRRENNKNKRNDFVSIHPGKPYCFRPYTLTLVEPGEIFFNRHKNSNWFKITLLGIVSITILFMCTKPTISQLQSNFKETVNQEYKSSPVISNSENNPGEKIAETDEIIYHNNIGIQSTEPLEKAAKSKEIRTYKVKTKKETKVLPDNRGMAPAANQLAASIENSVRLYDSEIGAAIKKAELSVQKGDLKIAYRILKPFLPHTDGEHQKKIINALDPYIQSLFKKAYMIRFYDIERSMKILQKIEDSGFTILPSYRKAIRAMQEMKGPSHSFERDIQ